MKKIITILTVLFGVNAFAQPCVPNTNSLSFNGTSSYVSFNTQTNLNPLNAITVEAWIYPAAWGITRSDGSIFCKHSWTSVSGESGYVLRAGASGTLSFNIGGDSLGLGTSVHWREVFSSAGALLLNTWNYVAGTFDGTHEKIYINGVLIADTTFTGTIKASTYPPKIGKLSDTGVGSGRYWNGKIDEVRVFNRALSQGEIADSMSVHIDPSSQTGLIGYWRMNDGTGTNVNDLSSGANAGTVNATTWSTQVPFNAAPPVPTISFISGQLVASSSANYQWQLNGTNISAATSQLYTPTVNGIYTVVVSNGTCTATSNPYNVTSLGIDGTTVDQLVSFAPNPAHDYIVIGFNPQSSVNQIELTDITGRILFTKSEIVSGTLKIPVNPFAKGIYFAKFYGTNVVLTKKFMVE